jgi:hypothetical protein
MTDWYRRVAPRSSALGAGTSSLRIALVRSLPRVLRPRPDRQRHHRQPRARKYSGEPRRFAVLVPSPRRRPALERRTLHLPHPRATRRRSLATSLRRRVRLLPVPARHRFSVGPLRRHRPLHHPQEVEPRSSVAHRCPQHRPRTARRYSAARCLQRLLLPPQRSLAGLRCLVVRRPRRPHRPWCPSPAERRFSARLLPPPRRLKGPRRPLAPVEAHQPTSAGHGYRPRPRPFPPQERRRYSARRPAPPLGRVLLLPRRQTLLSPLPRREGQTPDGQKCLGRRHLLLEQRCPAGRSTPARGRCTSGVRQRFPAFVPAESCFLPKRQATRRRAFLA